MSNGNYKDHLYALILAGGGGTRLWPRSRNKTPKQFLKLFDNKTLTQITAARFREMLPWSKIYCVTVSEEYKKEILEEVPDFIPQNILVEPFRRETGPAHGLGAAYIYAKDPDAVIVTEAADRLVKPVRSYLSTLKKAAELAYNENVLVSVGVEPRYPHVGLGHIKRGKEFSKVGKTTYYKVDKFVEKPPLSLAKKFTESGNYYWNAGQYVWRADDLLEAFAKHEPDIKKGLEKISKALGTRDEQKVIDKSYEKMPKIAIDYAVSERVDNMVVVGSDFFWTDIGDWKEVWNNLKKDHHGNVIIGEGDHRADVYNIDTSDALIYTNGRTVAVVDVDNVVVVDTDDALLICSKSKAQNVKKIVNQLKEGERKELL